MRTFGIGTTDRANLAAHLAELTDGTFPDDAVIYKKVSEDHYYVGLPGTNPDRLSQTYGGYWIYLGTLEVQDHELTEVQEED